MRFISIRHGETQNNVLQNQSQELYLKNRSEDTDLAPDGPEKCKKIGQFLKNNNIRIDKFYCSLQKRALKTMTYISNEYNPNIPKEAILELHEYGGIFLDEKGYPGLTDKEIKKQFPNVILPKDVDLSKGWYMKDHKETENEFRERLKSVINMFKTMAQNNEMGEDYTVCFISHRDFLNGFYSLINNSNFVVNNQLTISHDNLCISSFDITKDRKININYINFDTTI